MSTPASVIGTSAKDLLGGEHRRFTDDAGVRQIASEEIQTHLDGIEVGGHSRVGGCLKTSDGRLTTRTVRSVPIWEADLGLLPARPPV